MAINPLISTLTTMVFVPAIWLISYLNYCRTLTRFPAFSLISLNHLPLKCQRALFKLTGQILSLLCPVVCRAHKQHYDPASVTSCSPAPSLHPQPCAVQHFKQPLQVPQLDMLSSTFACCPFFFPSSFSSSLLSLNK